MPASLKSILPAEFELALQRPRAATAAAEPELAADAAAQTAAPLNPKRFLLDVTNNDCLDLAQRIEAAKALPPYFGASLDRRQELARHRLLCPPAIRALKLEVSFPVASSAAWPSQTDPLQTYRPRSATPKNGLTRPSGLRTGKS